jgi:predicted Zn finger-like uncharacterized protein
MQVTCEQCATRYLLNDAQVAGHPRVQFRCARCGHTTVVQVAKHPDRTVPTTPLPEFARGAAHSVAATMITDYQGLSLPADKTITITVLSGPDRGLAHAMTKPRVVLGRAGGDADIGLNDPEVSRWHCAIEVKDESVRLRDLDSTNGTYFDEERVRAAELGHKSEFRIGSSHMLITIAPKHQP